MRSTGPLELRNVDPAQRKVVASVKKLSLAWTVTALLLAGCNSGGGGDDHGGNPSRGRAPEGNIASELELAQQIDALILDGAGLSGLWLLYGETTSNET